MVYKGHVDEFVFFFQAEDGIRDVAVTGVQTCALPISWDLVIEAVKQMTAHSDVMRSDRLKQVMQEIDPAFNEKDLGFSRFSKFVIEAAHKGLITLTKLDNGQYEIDRKSVV